MPRLIPASAVERRVRVRRSGFTLTELMIAVALFSLVMASLMGLLVRQQRFYRGANEIIDTRTQLRQAAGVLPADIRSISSIGGDIKFVSDTMMEFLATFGTTIVCQKNSTVQFVAPSDTLTRHTLTAWLSTPRIGDTAFVYDEGSMTGSEDDSWLRARVDGVGTVTAGCEAFNNPNGDDDARVRYRFTLNAMTSMPGTVVPGATVRFARPVRYRFYKSTGTGGDNMWYLGYQQYTVTGLMGTWSATQPLAGPYEAWTSAGAAGNGLRFQYYRQDGTLITGTTTADMAAIARIDVSMKAAGPSARNTALSDGRQMRDSLLVRIAIRNRS
jgi:prepilin-type N-terminal cleavage/methylation domain-containing protein